MVVIMIGRNRCRQAARIAASGDRPSRSPAIAKSTSMIPFFFTMPISRMMPMMPITDRSNPPIYNASSAPTPADGSVDKIVSGWM
jgi:hypothetical protein